MSTRSLMFGASSAWVALLLVVLVFRGGGTTPVVPNRAPTPSPADLVQQADELAALGEYPAATEKYRAALEQNPEDIPLRFALGTALSHAGRQAETVEHFRWIVLRGDPASPLVQVARRWLVSAGELAEPVTFGSAAVSGVAGKVTGRTELKSAAPEDGAREARITLRGSEEANREAAFETTAKLGEPFAFEGVPPGTYQLTARLGESQVWQQKVVVEPGETTVVDFFDAGPRTAQAPAPASQPR